MFHSENLLHEDQSITLHNTLRCPSFFFFFISFYTLLQNTKTNSYPSAVFITLYIYFFFIYMKLDTYLIGICLLILISNMITLQLIYIHRYPVSLRFSFKDYIHPLGFPFILVYIILSNCS